MDANELFKQLQAEYPSPKCDEIVEQAIKQGVNLDEIRHMLDYIENSYAEQSTVAPNPKAPKGCSCSKYLHRLMERVRRL